jgi:hypothetical protein
LKKRGGKRLERSGEQHAACKEVFEGRGQVARALDFLSTTLPAKRCTRVIIAARVQMNQINSSRARVCPWRLYAAVDRRDYVVTLDFSVTPQNRHVSFDDWVRNLHTKPPIPLAHARSSSHLRPLHHTAQLARTSPGRHLEPFDALGVKNDKPARRRDVTKRSVRGAAQAYLTSLISTKRETNATWS